MRDVKSFFMSGISSIIGILIVSSVAIAAPNFQSTPIILNTADLVPKHLIKGSNYRLAKTVQNDGIINTYQLDTTDGFFFVESTSELLVRINELNALVKMKEVERQAIFKDSLIAGATAPLMETVSRMVL